MFLRLLLTLVTLLTTINGRIVQTQLVKAPDFNTETEAWVRNLDYALAKCPRLVPADNCVYPQYSFDWNFAGLQFPTIGLERYKVYQYLDVPAAGNGTLSFEFLAFERPNNVYHSRVDCAMEFTFEIRIGNDIYFHFDKETPDEMGLSKWDARMMRYSYPVSFKKAGTKILSISFTKDHYGHFTDYCNAYVTIDDIMIDYEYDDPTICDCECAKINQSYSIMLEDI
jgi:hypothetical protein